MGRDETSRPCSFAAGAKPIPAARDSLLFTPGPLTTSRTVKQAMLRDLGSRDAEFIGVVRDIRRRLLRIGGVEGGAYTAIPVQGSGTFAIESVVGSVVPPGGRILVAVNGAYGRRMARIAEVLGIDVSTLTYPENRPVQPGDVAERLRDEPGLTHVSACHCETTSGIMNPIEEIGSAVRGAGRSFVVDAMSSFGGVPLDVEGAGIDYLISSANKCVEGVPGFGFVLARTEVLLATEGFARSLALDLLDQHRGLEANGQFRFTPPTHALLAFHQALLELEAEGGVEGRAARYRASHDVLLAGMRALGFRPYLRPQDQGHIITSFHYPDDPAFHFEVFYRKLAEGGMVIYPGKVGDADCFRIGSIGRLFPRDMRCLLAIVERVLQDMNLELRPEEEGDR